MELSFGQRIDPENNLVECWFTHGALDWIKSQDLKDKNILMFGAGMGDRWLALRCKSLTIVERKEEWYSQCSKSALQNMIYIFRPCNDSDGKAEYYLSIPEDKKFDIIINDDAYRTECCQVAVDYFKANGGGVLISDNWCQAFVWISPKAEEIMAEFDSLIFEQEDHQDHDGVNKWKTAIHFIK
jgi:hypothetical protein